jgi:hypothetical protein
MSAADDQKRADEETLPDTSLHAYGEGREEDVEGDVDKLKSGDQHESQRKELEEEEGSESSSPNPPKH